MGKKKQMEENVAKDAADCTCNDGVTWIAHWAPLISHVVPP
jgi:hypothetical protein